jgi:hypothetical protein
MVTIRGEKLDYGNIKKGFRIGNGKRYNLIKNNEVPGPGK